MDQTLALTDADLVQRCLRGDADAFQQVTLRYYRIVSAFVYRRLQRPDLVEDLVQETFLEAFRSLKAGRRPEQLPSWLFGIAHNCCGKWLRRKRPLLFAPDEPPVDLVASSTITLHDEQEELKKTLADLDDCLADLPEDTRRLLELKHRHGKTCAQIAAELSKPVGTVKSLLARTYQSLRIRLRPGGEEGR